MPSPTTLLVVDNDQAMQAVYVRLFPQFIVLSVASGEAALAQLDSVKPDLMLIDLGLDDMDGLVLVSKIRARHNTVPIIVCSARDSQADRVLARKFGADDVIAKPFDIEDLEARIEAVLRRSTPPKLSQEASALIGRFGLLSASDNHGCQYDGKPFYLTPTEQRILQALIVRAGVTVTRAELADTVWGSNDAGTGHLIDVHIGRLRKKMRTLPEGSPHVVTTRGRGYTIHAGGQNSWS